MKKKNMLGLAVLAATLVACKGTPAPETETATDSVATATTDSVATAATLEGTWTQPIPGQSGRQGFTLRADGSAESVNMATLKYSAWAQPDDTTLVLTATSQGNGTSFTSDDTLTLVRLTADSLVLRKGQLLLEYTKEN